MVMESLGEKIRETLGKIAKSLFVDDLAVNTLIKDVQRALLQADVNVGLVHKFSEELRDHLKTPAPRGLTRNEYVVKVVYDTLVKFLGEGTCTVNTQKKPTVVMLVGLFGSGKTTTAGKLAHYYQKRGCKVCLVGLDVHRPAAMEQLQQVGDRIGADTHIMKGEKDPNHIWEVFLPQAHKYDLVIVDTAGRDALSVELIREIEKLSTIIGPEYTFLVTAADIGQAALQQARAFHDAAAINGVIVTKLDGTAKAGGALTACVETKAPVIFIGVGEGVDALESFDPARFVGKLLGMGDLEGLLEKAREAVSEEDAEDLGKKFLSGDYNLIDLYEQMQVLQKMGPLSKVMEMIPGFSQVKLPKEALEVQQEKVQLWRIAMDSLTREELEDPEILSADRIERAARGSGIDAATIRDLLKQYRQSKKMVKMLKGSGGDISKLMKKLPKGVMG